MEDRPVTRINTGSRLNSRTELFDAWTPSSPFRRQPRDEHDPEGSTIAFERAQLAALLAQAPEHLRDVDAALRRLAAGQFGLCERCAAPVGDERLAAVPVARRCMACVTHP
jgi:DnaK suppressor protein